MVSDSIITHHSIQSVLDRTLRVICGGVTDPVLVVCRPEYTLLVPVDITMGTEDIITGTITTMEVITITVTMDHTDTITDTDMGTTITGTISQ